MKMGERAQKCFVDIMDSMPLDPADAERTSALAAIPRGGLSPHVRVLRGVYRRQIPEHYCGNPLIQEQVQINVVMVEKGELVVPRSRRTSLLDFYEALRARDPDLFRRLLLPSGAAKAATTERVTPIKLLTGLNLDGRKLPGDEDLYGWKDLEEEGRGDGLALELFFQGNGLYFNRGSAFYDGEHLLAYPDSALGELYERGLSRAESEELAVNETCLQRPLLFFLVEKDGGMRAHLHSFLEGETYRQGMARLEAQLQKRGVKAGLAASPPLVIPGADGQPVYLSRTDVLAHYHASDVRHYLYCPYDGAVLLSCELTRLHCLHPETLAASFSSKAQDTIRMRMSETLRSFSMRDLVRILDAKGYADHWSFVAGEGPDGRRSRTHLLIKPLEGVYSHLIPFLTREGQFGVIQTSGTHGAITGNDGPTLRQLSAILKDINSQPPFDNDPIIAAASGSQGNDVPNLVCKGARGEAGLLHELAPEAALNENPQPRGTVTTPRVGITIRAQS